MKPPCPHAYWPRSIASTPKCIGWFASGRLQLRAGVVLFDGQPLLAPVVREAQDVADA